MKTAKPEKISFKNGRDEYAAKRGGYVVTKELNSNFPIGAIVIPREDGYTNEVVKTGVFYKGKFGIELL